MPYRDHFFGLASSRVRIKHDVPNTWALAVSQLVVRKLAAILARSPRPFHRDPAVLREAAVLVPVGRGEGVRVAGRGALVCHGEIEAAFAADGVVAP